MKETHTGPRPRTPGRALRVAGKWPDAILPRVFRHRVRVAARQDRYFEPRSGCRVELLTRGAGGDRVRTSATFPAAASAAVARYASPSIASLGSRADYVLRF